MLKQLLPFLIIFTSLISACQNGEPAESSAAIPTSISTLTAAPTAPISATITPEPAIMPATDEPSTNSPTASPPVEMTPTAATTDIPSAPVDTISLVPLIEGAFSRPVYLTHAYDARLFIVEQAGVVHIFKDGQLLEEPFLDISDQVGSSQLEQGLLSIAFHPNYQDNKRFFAYYTDRSGTTHISGFETSNDDENQANKDSEVILLSVDQPYPNHNGGQLAFGLDGYLYAGFGDGGSANDPLNSGQDPSTLLGSIIRLDVDYASDTYAVPASNPFTADDSRRNEIWAWGLRNPWRFSFDGMTGDLFIADVGQNIWEEVHFQPAESEGGENYGWNIVEGSHCFLADSCDQTGLELPIFEYSHQEGCSITGGYVYRGSQFPTLYGNYFVADFCSGNFWRLYQGADGSWSSAKILDSDLVISSFGEDTNGELYVLVHDSGTIYQIQP